MFTFAGAESGVEHGTIRATVLIDTIPAAFQMDEVLDELREHASGPNAGDTGETVTRELVGRLLAEESECRRSEVDDSLFTTCYEPATQLVGDLCLGEEFVDLLTLPAYELIQ